MGVVVWYIDHIPSWREEDRQVKTKQSTRNINKNLHLQLQIWEAHSCILLQNLL